MFPLRPRSRLQPVAGARRWCEGSIHDRRQRHLPSAKRVHDQSSLPGAPVLDRQQLDAPHDGRHDDWTASRRRQRWVVI